MNISIVVALPKKEDALKIRSLLSRYGFTVTTVCTTGANALAAMFRLDYGILICSHRLVDMYYREIMENKPDCFEVLLLASESVIESIPTSVLSVRMPIKASELADTVGMMVDQMCWRIRRDKKEKSKRSEKAKAIVTKAKMLLMERNHLSEEEAYRYIQKSSMDSGTNMTETAEMILMLLSDNV